MSDLVATWSQSPGGSSCIMVLASLSPSTSRSRAYKASRAVFEVMISPFSDLDSRVSGGCDEFGCP